MISNVKIKNFKVLKDVELKMSNMTILSGLNSMGKSSLIQVLLLFRQYFEKKGIENGLLLNGNYINIGKGKDALSIDAEKDEDFYFKIEWEKGETLTLEFEYKSMSNLQPLKKISPPDFSFSKSLFNTNFQYIAAERVSPKSVFPVSDFDINTLNSLGKNGEFTAHFLAEKGMNPIKIEKLIHQKSKSNTLLAQVDAWMSEITPGIRITANVIQEINQATLQYEFETSIGYTEKFRPENVGFGLTYVLPVVTAVLSAKEGDLIIIENPEAHLHPAGQSAVSKLIALAAQSGVQIIIETHSDHILNGTRVATKLKLIEPENISIFYFSKDKVSEEHSIEIKQPFIDEEGKLDEWPNGFFDEWENNLNQLLE
jgi:predicted ATPase